MVVKQIIHVGSIGKSVPSSRAFLSYLPTPPLYHCLRLPRRLLREKNQTNHNKLKSCTKRCGDKLLTSVAIRLSETSVLRFFISLTQTTVRARAGEYKSICEGEGYRIFSNNRKVEVMTMVRVSFVDTFARRIVRT